MLGPRLNGIAQLQQTPLGLAYQLDKDFALASALSAKTAHDLLQGLAQLLRLLPQGLCGWRALARDRLDESQDFF